MIPGPCVFDAMTNVLRDGDPAGGDGREVRLVGRSVDK